MMQLHSSRAYKIYTYKYTTVILIYAKMARPAPTAPNNPNAGPIKVIMLVGNEAIRKPAPVPVELPPVALPPLSEAEG